jgi:trehalose 6-phosphate phosphatase
MSETESARARNERRRPTRSRRPPPLGPDIALFLDLDGTVFELASTPDGVHPDPDVAALLASLDRRLGGAVALITGRAIADVDRLFPERVLPMAGQHGFERRAADGSTHQRLPPPAGDLASMRRELGRFAARHTGLLLEDKGATLALHYRRAPRLATQVHRTLRAQVAARGDAWTLQKGSMLVEVKPIGFDKGSAIADFMAEAPFRGRVPVFVGNDLTDEHGFAAVKTLGGWSVKVGPGRTSATFRLPDITAVRRWLAGAPSPDWDGARAR